MNIAFFLTPKQDVVCLPIKATMRQALERMERHRYTAVPLIDGEGRYVGTLTEGDLLWKMKNTPGLSFEGTEKVRLDEIQLRVKNAPVHIDAQVEDLIPLIVAQNFVPVVDDDGIFIGIIRRGKVIVHLAKYLQIDREHLQHELAEIRD